MRKHAKNQPEDDGRTIADMNIEGTSWYRKTAGEEREDYSDLNVRKLIKEAYKKYLLAAVIWIVLIFAVLLGISYLWLN